MLPLAVHEWIMRIGARLSGRRMDSSEADVPCRAVDELLPV